ncbi:MAG: terpene cyclase/mutase family protein [Akkermansiaceae bacterium]|jgi:squalene-hopene/tetraprenyl-beta-curcumene cyclase|tara:strand:+ start:1038 stop:2183 length:1146 start_codon:yes stop_codon:yes gene_type:complete
MKKLIVSALFAVTAISATAQKKAGNPHLSLKLEAQETIHKGNKFLLGQQHADGSWGDPKLPAFTAYVLRCLLLDPAYDVKAPAPAPVKKGLAWLVAQQKVDGGIYGKGMATYCTASSVMALYVADPQKYKETIIKARGFLINQQTDWGVKGADDTQFDGGIGYGGTYAHSDLSNTHLALEALYHTRAIATDTGDKKVQDLDWGAALAFVSRCQNLQETNKGEKVGNDGSFVYFPGNSKAGEAVDSKTGRIALRGYGSMSYAGLLSLVYADLDATDPRVKGVTTWINENYTLEENPGLGGQGLYYYYHAMAKSLVAANIPELKSKNGLKIDWRTDLAAKIINAHREDGSWLNTEASRWMENDAILVSSYAIMTLQQIHSSLQ